MKKKLVTAALTLALAGSAIAPASAMNAADFAIMTDTFERTYGTLSVGPGEQKPRNRCVVPQKDQQILNPDLYKQQVTERAACEIQLKSNVDAIRAVSGWSLEMDAALTLFGEKYSYTQAVQLRDARRTAVVDSWRGKRWSVKIESELGELAKKFSPAAYVLDQARSTNLIRVQTSDWSTTVESILRPMIPYYTPAEVMLKEKRSAYIAPWRDQAWSETMEQVLTPMAEEHSIPEAYALREEKREAALNIWKNLEYSADMDRALTALGAHYPAARVLLNQKKPGGIDDPDLPIIDPGEDNDSENPGENPGSDDEVPSSSSSDSSSGSSTGGIVATILGLLGLGGVAFYFAWFGI